MRILATSVVLAMLLLPALAAAEDEPRRYTNKQVCRRMTKQIAHFENTVLPMAKERGNEGWERSIEDHINRIKNRRADKCPEWGKQRTMMARAKKQAEQMQRMMVTAAKGAAKYFSGGLY